MSGASTEEGNPGKGCVIALLAIAPFWALVAWWLLK